MKRRDALVAIAGGAAYAGSVYQPAIAQAQPIKIGLVSSFSGGDNVALGKQLDAALAVYQKQHGDTIAGRKVVFIKRDDGGIAPDVAARYAQELIVQEKA